MKLKLLSAVALSAGLFSATFAVQADTLTYRGYISEITDLVTMQFVVNNAYDDSGVSLFTTSYADWNFDPFLAVWDSDGWLIGFNNDINFAQDLLDARIDLGQLADGNYTFTVGNWPYGLVGADNWQNVPIHYDTAQWALPPNWQGGTDLIPGGSGWGPWYVVTVTGVVPEPETWAMLLAGLGIVGAVARRRRQR